MVPDEGGTQDDLKLSMNYHLTRDVQLTLSTWLPIMMLTNSFHDLHYQEAYTEVLLANAWPFEIMPAIQLLFQISCKKY